VVVEDRAIWASTAELPSLGKLYTIAKDGFEIPGGKVMVAPLIGSEEKMLATAGSGQISAAVIQLISNCTFTPTGDRIKGLKPGRLLLGDQIYLMQAIRHVTLGTHKFKLRCPRCEAQFDASLDMPDGVTIQRLSDDVTEPFETELPFSKLRVRQHLWRAEDNDAIDAWVKARKREKRIAGDDGDPAYFYRFVRTVESISVPGDPEKNAGTINILGSTEYTNDGTPELEDRLLTLFNVMHGDDIRAIRDAVYTRDCGVEDTAEFQCTACKTEFVAGVPGGTQFFRPNPGKGIINLR